MAHINLGRFWRNLRGIRISKIRQRRQIRAHTLDIKYSTDLHKGCTCSGIFSTPLYFRRRKILQDRQRHSFAKNQGNIHSRRLHIILFGKAKMLYLRLKRRHNRVGYLNNYHRFHNVGPWDRGSTFCSQNHYTTVSHIYTSTNLGTRKTQVCIPYKSS